MGATAQKNHDKEKLQAILAEFVDPHALLDAARQMRGREITELDTYTPFPIHGLDSALDIRPSRLPQLVLAAGVGGGILALLAQWWTNAVDYPYIISGKPLFSLPANIPVAFEVIILSAAFAAFVGTLLLIGLPRLFNPRTRHRRFLRASNDKFLLVIGGQTWNAADRAQELRRVLTDLGARHVELLDAVEPQDERLPRGFIYAAAILLALAPIPPLWVAYARTQTSTLPALRIWKDMDFQPKFKSQTTSRLFADDRAMRPPVPGTVARGQLEDDLRLYRGLDSVASPVPDSAHMVSIDDPAAEADREPDWTAEIPISISPELMRRGRTQFNIYCAVCHGRAGEGDGPVSVRANALQQGTWVPPTSLHADYVREQPDGKLFNTITNGVRKMSGYGAQIEPEDRWAIVLYVRALQRSRNASPQDVAGGDLEKLRDIQ